MFWVETYNCSTGQYFIDKLYILDTNLLLLPTIQNGYILAV